jgi:kynurenine formamidase
MPEWPSSPGVDLDVLKFHARDGLWELNWTGIMHRCTHMDAPLHVTENTPDIKDYPLWRLAGTGVCLSIPKEKWGLITVEDLEKATPEIKEGDVVMINTGFHHKWADTDESFAYGCGMSGAGANWLVDKKAKLVGYSHQANDHPMATKLINHGLGPTHPWLPAEYKEFTGRDVYDDFPLGEDAHKNLMVKGGIPGIENVGGDLDEIIGKRCFFIAFPWRWKGGDGCIVRILAITDPDGDFRFEKGE